MLSMLQYLQLLGYPPEVRPPPIGLQEYIERIRAYIPCSTECFVLAIVYIDRVPARGKHGASC